MRKKTDFMRTQSNLKRISLNRSQDASSSVLNSLQGESSEDAFWSEVAASTDAAVEMLKAGVRFDAQVPCCGGGACATPSSAAFRTPSQHSADPRTRAPLPLSAPSPPVFAAPLSRGLPPLHDALPAADATSMPLLPPSAEATGDDSLFADIFEANGTLWDDISFPSSQPQLPSQPAQLPLAASSPQLLYSNPFEPAARLGGNATLPSGSAAQPLRGILPSAVGPVQSLQEVQMFVQLKNQHKHDYNAMATAWNTWVHLLVQQGPPPYCFFYSQALRRR